MQKYTNIINFKPLKSTGNSIKIRCLTFKRVAYQASSGTLTTLNGWVLVLPNINRSVYASSTFGHQEWVQSFAQRGKLPSPSNNLIQDATLPRIYSNIYSLSIIVAQLYLWISDDFREYRNGTLSENGQKLN